jgi:hypothetical protein
MDNYYAEALRDYAAVTYEDLHNYFIERLRYWCELYPPSQERGWADVDGADALVTVEDARETSCETSCINPQVRHAQSILHG